MPRLISITRCVVRTTHRLPGRMFLVHLQHNDTHLEITIAVYGASAPGTDDKKNDPRPTSWQTLLQQWSRLSEPARREGRNSQEVARQGRLTQQKARFRCVSRYIRPWCCNVL